MPKRSIFLASGNAKAIATITAYFSDTASIPSISRSKTDYSILYTLKPDFVFLQSDWVDSKSISRLTQLKSDLPKTKFFSLGEVNLKGFHWDGSIEFPVDEKNFRRVVLAKADLPNPMRLLVVSGQEKLKNMFKDYFEVRKDPGFEINATSEESEILNECSTHHCLLIDTTTYSDAGELFRKLETKKCRIPTIVFMNLDTTQQILEIRKWKAPVFFEINQIPNSMPDLVALIKKLVAFA